MLMAPFWSSAPVAWDIKNEVWLKTAGGIDILAVVVVLGTALLQVRGIAESARFNNVVVVLKLVVLLLFILAGFVFLKPENYDPFIPPNTGTFGVYGWSGILRGSSVVFFSFIGFDALSCNAGEAINPQVTVPLATVITLTLCTVLYILAALVMTGLAKYTTLGTADPIAVAVNAAGPSLYWLRPIVKLGAIAGLTSVVMVQVLGQARIFWAMAEDGLLPPVFAKLHPVYRTPYVTTAFTGITAGIIAGLLPIDVLGEMVSIGTLFAFAIVCAGVMVLRRTQPDLPRPFRTPHANVTGTLGILTCVAQMFALPAGTWVRFIVWLLLGTCVYYMYSRHHVKPYGARRAALLGLPLDVFTKVEHAAIEAGRHNLTAALQVHNAVVDGSAEAVRATSAQAIVARYWRTVAQATAASVGGARRRSLGAVAAADAQRAVELEWPPLLGAAYEQVEAAQAAAPQVREWGGLLPSPAVSPRGRATGPPRSADYYASLHVESVG
jgi:amino acid transporter